MRTQQAGFTLVELLVVLVLLALGSSLVVANMHSSLPSSMDMEAQRLHPFDRWQQCRRRQ